MDIGVVFQLIVGVGWEEGGSYVLLCLNLQNNVTRTAQVFQNMLLVRIWLAGVGIDVSRF